MNIIVIPDIHTKYDKAERIIKKYNSSHRFVFVGDYFDQFNDDTGINAVLSIDDWNKLKYFHIENGWYFSHAGITEHWFKHPVSNIIKPEYVNKVISDSIENLKIGKLENAIWSSDFFRGGKNKKGGILWNDWRNMDLIVGIKQVVGHTPINRIMSIADNVMNSHIINVDCSSSGIYMSEVLEINRSGQTKILDTSYV